MIDIKQIENEITELTTQLQLKKDELKQAKEANLKEQYGENFGCGNCAYGCCVDVADRCTYCAQGNCVYCNRYCNYYTPDNELSAYIRDKHYYVYNMLDTLNEFFDVPDIIKSPELHEKALEILRLRDEKEKTNE